MALSPEVVGWKATASAIWRPTPRRTDGARTSRGQLESSEGPRPDPTATREVLKKAQSQARVPPIESRVKVAEEYLARKKKRLSETEEVVPEAIPRRERFQSEVKRESRVWRGCKRSSRGSRKFSRPVRWTFQRQHHQMFLPRWNSCRPLPNGKQSIQV